jgi:hypothetical protein
MTEQELLALNVYEEARGEIPDGQAAIARIVKNRMALRYTSDGTIFGTVLAKDQFSWAWFGFETHHSGTATHPLNVKSYERIAHTLTEAEGVAQDMLDLAPADLLVACGIIAQEVMNGTFSGQFYDYLTDDAVLYLNPRILTKLPVWAIPDKLVCSIGHHDFYRA